MSVDSRQFRNACGSFATGVTVITTVTETGELIGLTANSFSSVSLDPPLVLFCLDKNAMSFGAFESANHFAVNILREDQQELSNNFAKPSPDKWSGIDHELAGNGCPVFPDSLAILECDVDAIHEAGDHIIVIGKVTGCTDRADGEPLLYYRGGYGRLDAAGKAA